jgi:hypothetical protein
MKRDELVLCKNARHFYGGGKRFILHRIPDPFDAGN